MTTSCHTDLLGHLWESRKSATTGNTYWWSVSDGISLWHLGDIDARARVILDARKQATEAAEVLEKQAAEVLAEKRPQDLPPMPRGMAAQKPCPCGRPGALMSYKCDFRRCGQCCSEENYTVATGGFCQPHFDAEMEKRNRSRAERGGRRSSASSSWTR